MTEQNEKTKQRAEYIITFATLRRALITGAISESEFQEIFSCRYDEAAIIRKAQEEIMDKFGILHGEAAVAFENYMNDPDRIKSPEAKALIEKARKLAESQGEEAVRRDERERVLKEVYDRLIPLFETVELHGHYRQILTDADISCLFAELRDKEKKEGPA